MSYLPNTINQKDLVLAMALETLINGRRHAESMTTSDVTMNPTQHRLLISRM